MTEYNIFCYSENYNDENSFQQPRYRAFNTEVGEEKYFELLQEIRQILKDFKLELNESKWIEGWEKVSAEQWKQLMELAKQVRGDDFKEGFEFISGIKIELEDYAYDKNGNILGKIINGKIIK
jgi:hypothetical protein